MQWFIMSDRGFDLLKPVLGPLSDDSWVTKLDSGHFQCPRLGPWLASYYNVFGAVYQRMHVLYTLHMWLTLT
jgi:hypothetical protein